MAVLTQLWEIILYIATTLAILTALGHQSLKDNTIGYHNSAVGYSTGSTIITGNNNTCIGYNAQVPSGILSNQVRIGNTSVSYGCLDYNKRQEMEVKYP